MPIPRKPARIFLPTCSCPGSKTYPPPTTAFEAIMQRARRTACVHSAVLSQMLGCELWFKREYSHLTGSFKERGARNALMKLSQAEKKKGVIAASAGNHALGLCYHGLDLGIPVTVVMPDVAPLTKVQSCRNFRARVEIHGNHLAEARQHADALGKQEGLTYINGFDHPDVISGAGTMGIEVLEVLLVLPDAGMRRRLSQCSPHYNTILDYETSERRVCHSWSAGVC